MAGLGSIIKWQVHFFGLNMIGVLSRTKKKATFIEPN